MQANNKSMSTALARLQHNVGRAAPRRGALRRCWKLRTKKTTDVVPKFYKAPLKNSDGAVDGGHYYYAPLPRDHM